MDWNDSCWLARSLLTTCYSYLRNLRVCTVCHFLFLSGQPSCSESCTLALYFTVLKNAIQCLSVASEFFCDNWEFLKVGNECFLGGVVSAVVGMMMVLVGMKCWYEKFLDSCGVSKG